MIRGIALLKAVLVVAITILLVLFLIETSHAQSSYPVFPINGPSESPPYAEAVRLTPPVVIDIGTPPVPPAIGLNGLSFAPEGLTNCEEASWYRVQAGLPERFEALIFRESRCTNTPISSTGCCVGYLQLSQIIFRDHRMLAKVEQCQANWYNIRGDDPLSKQRQMCMAKALYDVVGLQPWR